MGGTLDRSTAAPPGALGADRVRVASVPAGHPYVAAILDPGAVALLPDPPVEGAPAGQWWPPRLLEPAWAGAHAQDFDVLHVHFGLESHDPADVARALAAVQAAGRPVVHTVHDLVNPQLVDQTAHLAALDEVIPRADVLLTLTDAAADEIARRWGRTARVVPHPRLHAPAPTPSSTGPAVRVGVHLRDLRPNIDGLGAVATLVLAVASLRAGGLDVVAEVHLDDRVRDEEQAERIAALTAGRPGVELHRHPRLDDARLGAAIARLDVLVLPYAWGTHSGWVELAYDAAVPVAGTGVGATGAQHPGDHHLFALGDPDSLVRAVDAALRSPWSHPGAARADEVRRRAALRDAEARAVRDAHSALYRELVGAAS